MRRPCVKALAMLSDERSRSIRLVSVVVSVPRSKKKRAIKRFIKRNPCFRIRPVDTNLSPYRHVAKRHFSIITRMVSGF